MYEFLTELNFAHPSEETRIAQEAIRIMDELYYPCSSERFFARLTRDECANLSDERDKGIVKGFTHLLVLTSPVFTALETHLAPPVEDRPVANHPKNMDMRTLEQCFFRFVNMHPYESVDHTDNTKVFVGVRAVFWMSHNKTAGYRSKDNVEPCLQSLRAYTARCVRLYGRGNLLVDFFEAFDEYCHETWGRIRYENHVLAFAMGSNARLGKRSSVLDLPKDVLQLIGNAVFTDEASARKIARTEPERVA